MVSFGSLNVNGLGGIIKRKKIFNFIRSQNTDICLLQETHSHESCEQIWENQWGGIIKYCHGETNAHGVAVLCKRNLECVIEKITCDNEGRYLILDIAVYDKNYTVMNMYAPNTDEPDFFINLFENLTCHNNEDIIIGGDFNLVMDPTFDRFNERAKNNDKALAVLKEIMNHYFLCDIWRMQNEATKTYTWQKLYTEKGVKKFLDSRIDMFLVNYGVTSLTKTKIKPSICTDHSLILCTIEIDKIQKEVKDYGSLIIVCCMIKTM